MQANIIPCFISSKIQISTSCRTGMMRICGPEKCHFLSTENVTSTFHDFDMLHTSAGKLAIIFSLNYYIVNEPLVVKG